MHSDGRVANTRRRSVRSGRALAVRFACAGVSLSLLSFAASCERITHSADFSLLEVEPYYGICNACPASSEDLRHPPCPVASDAPDLDEVFPYVWRTYHLGFNPADWTGSTRDAFVLGLDLDCSGRQPDGFPVRCQPRRLADGGKGEPWVPLPHGIDNALAQRIFGPLYVMTQALGVEADLEGGINKSIAAGGSTVMIAVERWNGTPNDPIVNARIVSVAGISDENGGPPRWDGNDLWNALSDGPDQDSPGKVPNTTFKSDHAYVANGILVLDLGFLGTADLTAVNQGARLDMPIRDLVVVGDITRDALRNISIVGRWSYSDMKRATLDIADFLSGCNPAQRAYLLSVWPSLMETAPDLPLGPEPTPDEPCEAMSVGYGADAVRARVGGYVPVSSLPGGCPPP